MAAKASATKNEWFERGKVERAGCFPVLRYYRPNGGKVKRGAKVTLQRDDYVTDNCYKFLDTEPEYCVEHVLGYQKLLVRLELESTYVTAKAELASAKEELARGPVPSRDRHLKKVVKETTAVAKGNLDAAFTYFTDLLDVGRQHEWEVICARECDTAGYTARNGVIHEGVVRGRSFEGLRASLRTWLLKFVPQDVAEF